MDTAERTKKIANTCPDAFHGITVDFAYPVPIVITSKFPFGMTNCSMFPTGFLHAVLQLLFGAKAEVLVEGNWNSDLMTIVNPIDSIKKN